jgi:hypothetical protein
MGLGDNRRSPKMRRKVRQAKKQAREKRARDTAHAARKAVKPPAKGDKKR